MTIRRAVILGLQLVAISVAVWGIRKTYVKLVQADSPEFFVTTPANSYSLGTPIPLTASLKLPARSFPTSLNVCTLGLTTIRVASVTRNGVAVQPIHGVSDFVDDPFLLQDSYIHNLVAGDTVVIPWTIGSDRNGHSFLKDVSLNGDY